MYHFACAVIRSPLINVITLVKCLRWLRMLDEVRQKEEEKEDIFV